MNFPNVACVMAVVTYNNVNTNERTCHGRKSEKDGWGNEQEAEGGSESALETGSSSAKSASETALTAGRELTTGDRIYIYIYLYIKRRDTSPLCQLAIIWPFIIFMWSPSMGNPSSSLPLRSNRHRWTFQAYKCLSPNLESSQAFSFYPPYCIISLFNKIYNIIMLVIFIHLL